MKKDLEQCGIPEKQEETEPLNKVLEEVLASPAPTKPSNLRRFFAIQFESEPRLAVVSILISAVLIGLCPIFVRLSEVSPIATAFYRFFFACPVLITWMMYDNVKESAARLPTRPIEYALMVVAGLFFALDLVCYHWAVKMTKVLNASMCNNLTAVFVPLLSWAVFKQKPKSSLVVGVIVALIGTLVLVLHSFYLGASHIVGDILAVLSAVTFSGYIVIQKYLRITFTAATMMAWSGIATMYFTSFFMIFERGDFLPKTTTGWLNLIALALIVQVGGQGLMAYAMKHVSANFSSVALLTGPITAALIAWPVLNEPLVLSQMIGALIVILGVIIAKRNEETN